MDRCSQFIKNRALFGSFPTQDSINELEHAGVRYFIDLTTGVEDKTTPYQTKHTYMKYPIVDRRTPQNWKSFAVFIIKVANIISNLKDGDMIYVHCKGGHGRSGVVVASLLCHIFGMTASMALERTTKCHNKRSIMRDKWRSLGSPQTSSQKSFVHRFFEPLYFYRAYKTGRISGLPNFSRHQVTIPDLGTFPTAEAAFQASKNPTNKDYIEMQKNSKSPVHSKHIGKSVYLRKDWEEVKDSVMYEILRCKFEQNTDAYFNLVNTCIRPLVSHTSDPYWGTGLNGLGENKMGKVLSDLRESLLNSEDIQQPT